MADPVLFQNGDCNYLPLLRNCTNKTVIDHNMIIMLYLLLADQIDCKISITSLVFCWNIDFDKYRPLLIINNMYNIQQHIRAGAHNVKLLRI